VVEVMSKDVANRITDEFNNGQLWKTDLKTKIKLVEAVDVCRTFYKSGTFYQQQLFKRKINPLNFKNIA
jgi:hypothetical protein